jgi:hypothetical protein
MSEWHYGHFDLASAVLANGRLRVRVDGVQPAPEVEVMLAAYPHDPRSTPDVQMGLYWRGETEQYAEAPTPFTARVDVDVHGMCAPTLRIYHASGYRDVNVRHASPGAGLPFPPPPG